MMITTNRDPAAISIDPAIVSGRVALTRATCPKNATKQADKHAVRFRGVPARSVPTSQAWISSGVRAIPAFGSQTGRGRRESVAAGFGLLDLSGPERSTIVMIVANVITNWNTLDFGAEI